MKRIVRFEFKLVLGGNGVIGLRFEDNTTDVVHVPAAFLASCAVVLSQPEVYYDGVNKVFTTPGLATVPPGA
ncbi:MAG TPA: hypothetical protein VGN63_19155 [Flavisolibacter sp.]|jgi:hypothetical protein|nr:hypothetical protein [Flavisolibacter sp.]